MTTFAGCSNHQSDKSSKPNPNILIIVADDLGYSDIEPFGGEISTPHLSALASEGIRLSNFYASPTCSPSRAMLLTGTDNHPVGLATMPGHLAPNQSGRPGYEMYLNDDAFSVASRFQQANYNTIYVGKWHIGSKPEHWPEKRGFTNSFALLEGGASHFGDMIGPTSKFAEANYVSNGERIKSLPEDFYSSTFYTDQTIKFISDGHRENSPFFAILGYTAPHWPLQVPDEYYDLYTGDYDAGYQAIAARRLDKLKEIGVLQNDRQTAKGDIKDWETLAPQTQAIEARKMEIYAAMVTQMDAQIGRLVDYLKASEQFDDTLIIFISDNGAEGKSPLGLHNNKEWVPANFDLSSENMGRPNSFTWLGEQWARIGSLPHQGIKTSVYEGGIRVPFIAKLPQQNQDGTINKSDAFIMDLAPTFLDFAGLEIEQNLKIPMTGRSLRPVLEGQTTQIHGPDKAFGWEILGAYGARQGKWKIVRNGDDWELFNLADDPSEQIDLSNHHPERLKHMQQVWNDYAERFGVILPNENVGY